MVVDLGGVRLRRYGSDSTKQSGVHDGMSQ
jgi:hypothetical protein